MTMILLNDFAGELMRYGREAPVHSFEFWVYIITPLIAVWVITLVMLYLLPLKTAASGTKSRIFQINLKVITASLLVAMFINGLYIIYWKSDYYEDTPIEFSHLSSLVLILGIAYFIYSHLKRLFNKEKVKELIGQSITQNEEAQKYSLALRQFNRTRQLIVIPALGFVLLLIGGNQQSNLVSIMLDTSISMETENNQGEVPIEASQQILQSAINGFKNTDLIITHFEQGAYKSDIPAITRVKDQNGLTGHSIYFPAAELFSAQRYISTLGSNLTDDSPICETMWKNFLHTKDQLDQKSYDQVILIIITDGIERISGSLNGFLCDNQELNNLYSSDGMVYFIDLGETSTTPFWNKVNECGYLIQEGSDAQSYLNSLNSILDEVKYDNHFVFAMAGIYLLFAILTLAIQPKPLQ